MQHSNFDYTALDKDTATFVIQETAKIKIIMSQTVEGIIETGERLERVKQKLKHGEFMNWVENEVQCHYSTALHFVRVWQTFGDRKKQIARAGINVSVLYLLAAPSTPEQLRTEIVERAQSGNPVSFAEAKKLKKEYAQQQQNNILPKAIEEDTSKIIDVSPKKPYNKAQSLKSQIIQRSIERKFWTLGTHLLYYGSAEDRHLRDRVNTSFSLNIGFPDSLSWNPDALFIAPAKSTLIFHSVFQDLDLRTLRNIIQKSIELCTESGESIFFSNLPYPEMIILAEKLKCSCIIADSNFQRCKEIANFWNKVRQRN